MADEPQFTFVVSKFNEKGGGRGTGTGRRITSKDPARDEFVRDLERLLNTGDQIGKAKPDLMDELVLLRDTIPFLADRSDPSYLAAAMIIWDSLKRPDQEYLEDENNSEEINEKSSLILEELKEIISERQKIGVLREKSNYDKEAMTLFRTICINSTIINAK